MFKQILLIALAATAAHADLRDVAREHVRKQSTTSRRGCIASTGVIVKDVRVDGAAATVIVTAGTQRLDLDRPMGVNDYIVRLAKKNGAWSVASSDARFDLLARQIASAKTQKERWALLAANDDLISLELDRALAQLALNKTNDLDPGPSGDIAAVAEAVADEMHDLGGKALATGITGIRLRDAGKFDEAVAVSREALRFALQSQDPDSIARAKVNLGRALEVAVGVDISPEAEALFRDVIAAKDNLESVTVIARAMNFLSIDSERVSDYYTSFNYKQQQLAFSREIGDATGVADGLQGIGVTLQGEHDCELALPFFDESIRRGKAIHSRSLARLIGARALCYHDLGRYAEARRGALQCFTYSKRSEDALAAAGAVYVLGLVDVATGNVAAAERRWAQHAALFRKNSFAGLAMEISKALVKRGEYTDALEWSGRDTSIDNGPDTTIDSKVVSGWCYRGLRQLEKARQSFLEAVDLSERLRHGAMSSDREQLRSFQGTIGGYRGLVNTLIDLNQPEDAFRYAELAKARLLLDTLRNGRNDVTRFLTSEERTTQTKLTREMSSLQDQIDATDSPAESAKLKSALVDARLRYEAFQNAMSAQHPEVRMERGEVAVPDLDQLRAALPANSLFIDYLVLDNDHIAIFTAGSRLGVHIVAAKSLQHDVAQFTAELSSRSLAWRLRARRLFHTLIAPIAKEIAAADTLLIAPDGPLWRLPFEALIDDHDHYLVERAAVAYAPSLSVYAAMASQREAAQKSESLLAVGNPRLPLKNGRELRAFYRGVALGALPEAAAEVSQLRAIYGAANSAIFIDSDASESRVRDEAPKHSILHFATHAIVDDASPMYSRLVLARDPSTQDDGMLEAWEIMQMPLNADLVILSACETGRGKVFSGEGTIGLVWAFFVAGARATLATHWPVASAGTAEFAVDFHRAWHAAPQERFAKAHALRATQLKMIHSRKYAHPFYWASFALFGDA